MRNWIGSSKSVTKSEALHLVETWLIGHLVVSALQRAF